MFKFILGTLAFIGIYALASWLGDIMPWWVGLVLFIGLMVVSLRALFTLIAGDR